MSDGKTFAYKRFLLHYAIYLAVILEIVVLILMTDKFFTANNVANVLRQISLQGIIAVGMTMVILVGQIDLSVGAVVAFAAVLNAILLKQGWSIPLCILFTLAVGSLWGLFNGYITAHFRVHSFLVTLATMTFIRGMTYTLVGGMPVGGLPKPFFPLGAGLLPLGFINLPYPVIYMLFFFVVGIYFLQCMPLGREIYAVGGNEEAARLSGINTKWVKILTFVIASFLAAASGIVLSSRLMAGSPEVGTSWELDIIAAVIIGGTSFSGGEGKLLGTLIGMLFIGILTNGMVLLDVTPYVQMMVRGLVILIAVVVSSLKDTSRR
jgi:ribose transport system permease protein